MAETPELIVPDLAAWVAWLRDRHTEPDGVFLVMAKKGVTDPTSLSYEDALQEALCWGWIDGQRKSRDETTFLQRFTPRRRASPWSQKNVERVARLVADGRMQPSGQAEIDRAKEDGRWDAAYPGSATIQVPDDLRAALDAEPAAAEAFAALKSQDRFSVLYRVSSAKRADTRARRIEDFVGKLGRGEPVP